MADEPNTPLEQDAHAIADWHLERSKEEVLVYAKMMEDAAKRPELILCAPGLRLAAKMLRDAVTEPEHGI